MSIKLRKILLIGGPVIAVVIIAGALMAWTHQTSAHANACGDSSGKVLQVTIKDGQASPQISDGQLCDRITFTNQDNVTREIAFGPHENHLAYDGIADKFLNKNQSFTITLNQPGTFHFHDHLHDEAMGYFNVAKVY